jgi:AhpD family alkylhydroperoxidase
MSTTAMSRFQIHDDLTAPEGSMGVLRSVMAAGGQPPNYIGVLAGAPAVLRAYTRSRFELHHGALPVTTQERIALAVADHHGSEASVALHTRTARAAGLAVDEVALAREFDSREDREAKLLRYLKALLLGPGGPPMHLLEEVREAGWTDEQILEAIAWVSLESFVALVNVAGEVPVDGSSEESRTLRAA